MDTTVDYEELLAIHEDATLKRLALEEEMWSWLAEYPGESEYEWELDDSLIRRVW